MALNTGYEYSEYYYADAYEDYEEVPNLECPEDMAKHLPTFIKDPGVLYCNQTYDTVLCFPSVQAGQYVYVSCPTQVDGVPLNPLGTVQKYCFPNGTWDKADYKPCLSGIEGVQNSTQQQHREQFKDVDVDHMLYITIIHHTGTVLSLVSVLVALVLFYYCRGLRTLLQSVRTHLLLCLLIKDMVWILMAVSLPKLQSMSADNTEDKAYPWTCQLIKFAFNYLTTATYFWLLCEGVYFFITMVWDLSYAKGKFWKYAVVAWGGPFFPVVAWAIVQASKNNIGCTIVVNVRNYIYITPILFILLLIIIFLACTAYFLTTITATSLQEAATEYLQFKKTIKATLIVFPVVTVIYVIKLIAINLEPRNEGGDNNVTCICFMYMSAILESLQGFFVSLVYCFVNKQVWYAVKNRPKKWRSKKNNKK